MGILEKRINLWNQIKKVPYGEVKATTIIELNIYKGQAGIYNI